MKPTNFKQVTKVLQRPSVMPTSNVQMLPVWCDGKQCVSKWTPNLRERMRIALGGGIWLGVMSGKSQPPVFLSGVPVFATPPVSAYIKAAWYYTKEKATGAWSWFVQMMRQPDKRKHLAAGFAIGFASGVALHPGWGVPVTAAAGGLKEWWDSMGHGTVEKADFAVTMIGGVLGTLLSIPVYCWLR